MQRGNQGQRGRGSASLTDYPDIRLGLQQAAHPAAGVWSALVFGFGGVRDYDGQLSFAPTLPRSWTQLAFSLRFRGRQIRIQLSHDEEQYLLDGGDPLKVTIRGEPHLLTPGTAVAIKSPLP